MARASAARRGSTAGGWRLRTGLDRADPGRNGHGAYVPASYLARGGDDEAEDVGGRVMPDRR